MWIRSEDGSESPLQMLELKVYPLEKIGNIVGGILTILCKTYDLIKSINVW